MSKTVFDLLQEALEGVELLCTTEEFDGEEIVVPHVYPTAAPEGAGKTHAVYQLLSREELPLITCSSKVYTYRFAIHLVSEDYDKLLPLCWAAQEVCLDLVNVDERVCSVDWHEPDPEAFEERWGVQRRSPVCEIIFDEGDV